MTESPKEEAEHSTPKLNGEQNDSSRSTQFISWTFKVPIVLTFVWIFLGISGIVGYRMWWNSPIHPSFMPFAVVACSAIIAFSIVLALNIVTGRDLNFQVGDKIKFTGTSGPVVLWILAFLAVVFAFSLSGTIDLSQSDLQENPPLHELGSQN